MRSKIEADYNELQHRIYKIDNNWNANLTDYY